MRLALRTQALRPPLRIASKSKLSKPSPVADATSQYCNLAAYSSQFCSRLNSQALNMSFDGRGPILPPPTMLPPPVPVSAGRPGSSSSGRKRPRQHATPGSSYASSTSSDFSLSVKRKVERMNDAGSCWHCGARPTDICHVIGKRDHEVSVLHCDSWASHCIDL